MISARVLAIKTSAALGVGLAFLIVLGCGDDSGLAKRYPVRGTVNYKGQGVPKGRIDFLPQGKDGRSASGEIQDGSYFLTTQVNGDGALPGAYKVTVTAVDVEMPAEASKSPGAGQAFAQSKAAGELQKKAKKLVPAKYGSVDKTDLGAEVKAQDNKIDFDLKD
jgi:hypothetical protein